MEEPLISVLVPIYKIDRYLGICIESLLNQTYKNLEIILVDDGSPDRCPEICDLYSSKDERIKVIHKENGGLVSARKAALMAAKGSYIGYVDGDDWVGPGFYHSLYSSIKESDADIAIAGFSRDLFSSTKNILNAIPSGVYEGETLDAIKKQMIADGDFYRHGITTYLWNKLFKREVIEQYQMAMDNRITIGEDAATVYPTIMASKKIVITDNCAYHYRQREDSMLKTATNHNNEYLKVMFLHDYMKQSLSGGTLKDDGGLANFPFAVNLSGKKLAVYGAGTFGQQLVRRLKNENQCTITTWVDDDYWEYRRCCMDVDPIEQICKVEYDAIVIALIDPVQIEKIKHLLYDYGVEEKMIITVSSSQEQRDKALKLYLQEAHEISEGLHS